MTWWKAAVIYQIYPRSFQDSNDDGIGDIKGITRRLPYLSSLGVDAIWLSPIFQSPMDDFGYDISDYCEIAPIFGTMHDFDELLKETHRLGMKLLLDFVPNHTSDQHPWFRQSSSSRSHPMRDWFIWQDPAPDGAPPNNWLSEFGGCAWELDSKTGQFYYHAFLPSQPDLNWRNPDVRHAMHDVMRFWLDKGVDGFRVDVIWHLMKDVSFRNNPTNPLFKPGDPPHQSIVPLYTADLPDVHDVIRELRAVTDEYDDRLLIGEIYLPLEKLVAYYGINLDGVHLPFNFALLEAKWTALGIAAVIADYEARLPSDGWPNWVLSNHDRRRIVGRVGSDQARVAAMLLLTLRGTPTVYYGDELGIPQVPIPPDRIRDPFEKRVPNAGLGRDGARTPMQWDLSGNAGFSSAEPWLPLSDGWAADNVESLDDDPSSIYSLYRNLIHLRRNSRALTLGSYAPIMAAEDLLVYAREWQGEEILVALNFGATPVEAEFPFERLQGTVLASTHGDRLRENCRSISLRPNEGLLIAVSPSGF